MEGLVIFDEEGKKLSIQIKDEWGESQDRQKLFQLQPSSVKHLKNCYI